jgi:hypothetical protein
MHIPLTAIPHVVDFLSVVSIVSRLRVPHHPAQFLEMISHKFLAVIISLRVDVSKRVGVRGVSMMTNYTYIRALGACGNPSIHAIVFLHA